jgi:mutator protein MutT
MRHLVVAAAVIRHDGSAGTRRRAAAAHLGGMWEFPGGKTEPGESIDAALVREIREELGCDSAVGPLLLVTTHVYPEVRVELHFFETTLHGEPMPQLGQQMAWVDRDHLRTMPLPDADAALVALLTRDVAAGHGVVP